MNRLLAGLKTGFQQLISRYSGKTERIGIMDIESTVKKYLPMSETAYLILLSLTEPRHGYGISKWVKEKTNDRISLGSGTIYGTLSKMEKDKLITVYNEVDNRIIYEITSRGKAVLKAEFERLSSLIDISKDII